VAPIYRLLGVPRPAFVPRASLTLVEPSLQRLLAKFGWDLPDLDQQPERLAARLQGQDAGGLEDEIDDLLARVRVALDQVGQRLTAVDSSLLSALDRTRTKTQEELQKLAQKLRAARQDREGTGMRQIRRLCANLRPRGRLQERVFGPLGFLATHGPELADAIVAAAEPFTVEHGILEL
jgi:uncharacterized protein YllA (UPF0747 family)